LALALIPPVSSRVWGGIKSSSPAGRSANRPSGGFGYAWTLGETANEILARRPGGPILLNY